MIKTLPLTVSEYTIFMQLIINYDSDYNLTMSKRRNRKPNMLSPHEHSVSINYVRDWNPAHNKIKDKKDCLWKQRTHTITKIGVSV